MQAKKNLTNAQRIMLDKLYSQQFDLKRQEVSVKRTEEFAKLEASLIARATKRPEVAKAMKLQKQFREALEAIRESDLKEIGIRPSLGSGHITLSVANGYDGYDYRTSTREECAEVTAFKAETDAIHARLNKAANEMRLRIHGSDVTYDEIEKEINEILKGVKL